ncbi:uncharacterized protein LOC103828975 isoform X2 [Brassica rapa]|nr:uncharacterized protein LOC103828975 isoform X2 [Brassica rapa]XP_033131525.1 uncharacterized protein LOC103828975 isoform X2 [Brassica rapa]
MTNSDIWRFQLRKILKTPKEACYGVLRFVMESGARSSCSVLSLLWITAKIPAMFGVFDKEMTKLTNKEFVVLALKELPNGGEDELLPLKSLLARSVFQIRVTLYNFTPNHRTFSVSTITEDLIIDNQADVCNLAGESLVFPAFMYTSLSEAAENILPSSEGARGLTASSSGVAVVGKKV